MKKVLLVLTILLVSILNTSCSNDVENNSQYEGIWKGTYTGDEDSGTWEVDITSNGSLNGTFTSSSANFTIELNGNVDSNGHLEATYEYLMFNGEFTGDIEGNNASGVWENNTDDFNGTWEGSKE